MSVADIERTVGMPALAQIRSGGMLFVRAANEGRTVIEMFPKEKITEDFDALADRLLGTMTPVATPKSSFGLFSRPRPPPAPDLRSRVGRDHSVQRLRSCQVVPPSGAPGSFCGFSPVRRSICSTPRR